MAGTPAAAQFTDSGADRESLPTVPPGFRVTLFAREPLVRQPCSMAFDALGRLFVGMGPQYRSPTPETPGDRVVLLLDTDQDGVADTNRVFASGFNAVQGLAWHGRDLWVANAPDLTVVRDLDGDDQADEYVRVYTDLGNLEHGLHGLNWAPDGRLYMSKGNSKGLTKPGRVAPKPFRDLWGVTAPAGTPDFPEPQTYRRDQYRHAYHDPADDWGLYGGILRCDDGGRNLEIVSRGFRNPWDITPDSGFHWLGTDNDQTAGDRVFMHFTGAHFGWNHPWSAQWADSPEGPAAPISGPLFEGSGTGIIYCDSAHFPDAFRGVFFINDWLRKTTFVWRPTWDGALLRPAAGTWTPFVQGGSSLYRPTDIEVGPDGALWVLGWSSGYGAEWKDGQLTNEGRVFRIDYPERPPLADNPRQWETPLRERSLQDLAAAFDSPLPVRRIDAQDEIVRRGEQATAFLMAELQGGGRSEMRTTWTAWALGRQDAAHRRIDTFFAELLGQDARRGRAEDADLNLEIQALRILAYRARRSEHLDLVSDAVQAGLRSDQPRIRFEAVQALREARLVARLPELLALLAVESDRTTYYAGWQTLSELATDDELRALVDDPRDGVRRAAVLGLLEEHALAKSEVERLVTEHDGPLRALAKSWLEKVAGGTPAAIVKGPALRRPGSEPEVLDAADRAALATAVTARGKHRYEVVAGGLQPGARAYTDREYRLRQIPPSLLGADVLRTANADDGSRGSQWLTCQLLLPARVHVAIDTRQTAPPAWVRKDYEPTGQEIVTDDCRMRLYAREVPAGRLELGGNTDDGKPGGKSNYLVVLEALPLPRQTGTTTLDDALAGLERADPLRGELLFRHAGCSKCHSLDATRNGFGPNLRDVGRRATARHLVQSMLEPSAVITEGFNRQVVVTDEGRVLAGILLEESGLSLTLGQPDGQRVTILKTAIDHRRSDRVSAMPEQASLLAADQVADLAAFLLTRKEAGEEAAGSGRSEPAEGDSAWNVKRQADRLVLSHAGQRVGDFVFRDPQVLRPYFANLHAPGGTQVTRTHPPVEGRDATDHATMHPGIWLAFGDLNGVDFWRNKGRIEHLRFVQEPTASGPDLKFATRSRLVAADGSEICQLTSRIGLTSRSYGWLLTWEATFQSDDGEFTFGDQEEMGFGARVATPLTEKNGGRISSSRGLATAGKTWGQPAEWCDYSGPVDGRRAGITLLSDPENFRGSWWHNRDYGVFVANPFGRAAMRQGDRSTVRVRRGEPFRLRFAAVLHDGEAYDPAGAYADWLAR